MGERTIRVAEAQPEAIGLEFEGIRLSPRLRWRILQIGLDIATVFLAASATYWCYLWLGIGQRHYVPGLYLKLHLLLSIVTVFALHGQGSYRSQMGLLRIDDVGRVVRATSVGFFLLLMISFVLRLPDFSRINGLLFLPVTTLALVGQRVLFWSAQRRFRWLHRDSMPVLIYGAGQTGQLLARCLLEETHLGLDPVGFLDDDESLRHQQLRVGAGVQGRQLRVLGDEQNLDRVLETSEAKIVFLAIPTASNQRMTELCAHLEARRLHYFFVPSAGDMLLSSLQFGQVAGMPVFTRRRPAEHRAYSAARRGIDVIIAAGTLLFSLPVLAVSALLIKLTSPGPVVFSQERIGKGGKPFLIHKLRTMHLDAPKYAVHPQASGDSRIFPVGRWLRRLSIDELPQLWNVLKGEMSVVGPRPEMPFIVRRYNEVQRQRLTVTPGVTGLWQISADRAFSIHDNMQYDLYYIENRSLSLDLAILVMTPFVLLARNRAR